MAKKKAKKSKKTKSKKPKKSAAKKTKKVKKKVAKKKSGSRKPKVKKSSAASKPMKSAAKPMPVATPGEERVGIVTHYYNHLSVAIIQLESGSVRTGDTIHIKGHTSDFRQQVGSIEVNHAHVDQVQAGESFGVKVNDHAREHDVVYKVTNP
jgi:translation elongation factor EF-Tu-like GTPase